MKKRSLTWWSTGWSACRSSLNDIIWKLDDFQKKLNVLIWSFNFQIRQLNNLQIKLVCPSDVHDLLALSYKTFYDAFFVPFNSAEDFEAYTSVAFNVDKLLSEINNPYSVFYFALIGDEKAGYMKLNYSLAQTELQDENAVEIERIYVLETHQGKKIGNQLLDFAVAKAIEAKLQYIWLGVWEHNIDARRFYERAGFVKFGSHDFWVGNDKQTDFLMKKEL